MTKTAKDAKNKKHRRIRYQGFTGGIHSFEIYSLTRDGHDYEHTVEVDIESRYISCSCEDFSYRHARHWPKIDDTARYCKHLDRCVHWLRRNQLLPDPRICANCNAVDARFELADENGHPVPDGFICVDCVRRAQMMGLDAEPPEYSGYDEWLDELPEEMPEAPAWEYRGMMGQPSEVLP